MYVHLFQLINYKTYPKDSVSTGCACMLSLMLSFRDVGRLHAVRCYMDRLGHTELELRTL